MNHAIASNRIAIAFLLPGMPRENETIYDAEKLAKFFGVTKQTIWEWCKKGKLPGFKIGKEWKVRAADLQKMIARKIHTREEKKSSELF